ncbi:cell wall hydrolase [Parvibaculum sp.]|uniref:cell wall hydrolase n=1 Tax=Parvibaculum sp. TaxID=2024848 RepID=UPI00391D9DBF
MGIVAGIWSWLRGSRRRAAETGGASNPVASPPASGVSSARPDTNWNDPFGSFGSELQISGASSFFQTTPQPAPPAVDPVEKDWLARTIWGEARGESAAGKRAVAAVIMNRVASRRYPNSVQGVVTQHTYVKALGRDIYQFSMWDPLDHNSALARSVTDRDAQFRTCLEIAEEALSGRLSDPTGGATMYYAPAAMYPPGATPRWDFSKLRYTGQIGGHRFYVEI